MGTKNSLNIASLRSAIRQVKEGMYVPETFSVVVEIPFLFFWTTKKRLFLETKVFQKFNPPLLTCDFGFKKLKECD